ncbi:MAG: HAMP domain-containing histidine kinase [Polaromonas sp.]|nr:HAMP domain-containing histidine kinase [Polaromonas sp.]
MKALSAVPSIRHRVLLLAMSALAAGTLLLAGGSWFILTHELDDVFEDNLRQVALAVASHHGTRVPAPRLRSTDPLPPILDDHGDFGFVTAAWTREGVPIYQSGDGTAIPFLSRSGLSTIKIAGENWYLYTIVLDTGIVQAAQRERARKALARETVSAILLPALFLLLVLAGLLSLALQRGLGTLTSAAGEITSRSVASLHAINLTAHPPELQPLILAINDLMQRLGKALTVQRDFLADAAHELRTPVAALRLQLHLLEQAASPTERETAIASLGSGIARAQRLVEQLLQLSRLAPETPDLHRTKIDLALLVRGTVARFSASAEQRQIDLGAIADQPVGVFADREQLGILLGNLVDNALRHTPGGGRIDVEARSDGLHAWLSVRDDGPGIAESERAKVFERFYRVPTDLDENAAERMPYVASHQGTGSGLGLAIVREVALRHGAEIALSTGASGVGLIVTVRFEAI